MSLLTSADSEVDFLHSVVKACQESWHTRDGTWQAAPVICAIPFSGDPISRLLRLGDDINHELPDLYKFSCNRAARAYNSTTHRLTKPSYIGRISRFDLKSSLCQIESIEQIVRKEPGSGGLVFSVFHPRDLHDRL